MLVSRAIPLAVALVAVLLTASAPAAHAQCPGGVRTRRSWRSLSAQEKGAFQGAVRAMKQNGQWDYFIRKHRAGMDFHGTSQFLTMHRGLIREFEDALLAAGPGVTALPYWDELLDSTLQTLAASPVFTRSDMAMLQSGPLSEPFDGLTDDVGTLVARSPPSGAPPGFTWLPQSQVLAAGLAQFATFGEMSRVIEAVPHGSFHMAVGGHMGEVSLSPADPVFWLHHAYIDLLWAAWQDLSPQNAANLATVAGQQTLAPDGRAALYENQWSNADMLNYRDRMCFTYEASTGVAQNATKPTASTASGRSANTLMARSASGPNNPALLKLQPMPESAIRKILPNMCVDDVRKAEATLNIVAESLNKDLRAGRTTLSDLTTVADILARGNARYTERPPCRTAMIRRSILERLELRDTSGAAEVTAPLILAFFIVLMVA